MKSSLDSKNGIILDLMECRESIRKSIVEIYIRFGGVTNATMTNDTWCPKKLVR